MRNSVYKYIDSELRNYNMLTSKFKKEHYRMVNEQSQVRRRGKGKEEWKELNSMVRMIDAIDKVVQESDIRTQALVKFYYKDENYTKDVDYTSDSLGISRRYFYTLKRTLIEKIADELGINY